MAFAPDAAGPRWFFSSSILLSLCLACASGGPPTPDASPRPQPEAVSKQIDPKVARLEARLAERPKDAELMRELAETWMEKGDEGEALNWLRRATETAPGDAELWVRLGDMEERGGHHRAAIRALNRALEIEPAWIEVARRRDQLEMALAKDAPPPVAAPRP